MYAYQLPWENTKETLLHATNLQYCSLAGLNAFYIFIVTLPPGKKNLENILPF